MEYRKKNRLLKNVQYIYSEDRNMVYGLLNNIGGGNLFEPIYNDTMVLTMTNQL